MKHGLGDLQYGEGDDGIGHECPQHTAAAKLGDESGGHGAFDRGDRACLVADGMIHLRHRRCPPVRRLAQPSTTVSC